MRARAARTETMLALGWLPFAGIGLWAARPGNPLGLVVAVTLLFSFSHQGPTIALVHGDPAQRALRRKTFTWSAPIFAVAIAVGLWWAPLLLALVAASWNIVHTLQQRYGLVRAYGRSGGASGDRARGHARLERVLLFTWLAAALAWAAGDGRVPGLVERARFGDVNGRAIELLVEARGPARMLFVVLAVASVALLAAWVRAERRLGPGASAVKHRYLASTLALLVVIGVSPAAGFVGYVGSHAFEYFVVVNGALARRYRGAGRHSSPLAAVIDRPRGRVIAWSLYGVALMAFVAAVDLVAPYPWSSVVLLTVGGCHIFWDGYIWKLRRPEVAASLGVGIA